MCADKNVGLAVGKIAQDTFIGCTGTCRVKVEAGGAGVWKEVMNFFFNLFRAKTELPQVGTFAVGTGLWNCKRLAALVAHQSVLFLMISEGHVAGLAGGSPPADGAFDHWSIAAAVLEQNDLLFVLQRSFDLFDQPR